VQALAARAIKTTVNNFPENVTISSQSALPARFQEKWERKLYETQVFEFATRELSLREPL
jgi:hypothetical protein